VSIDTGGLRSLRADLGKAAGQAVSRASQAVRKTAHDIEADAKVNAPVDTGNLRGSISRDIKTLSTEIGPTANYGRYVEEGTSRMAPQPYMNPAADRRFPQFDAAMDQIAREAL
jgi:HK97 gp10 family phage protein